MPSEEGATPPLASRIRAIRPLLADGGDGPRDALLDRYCAVVAATFCVEVATITIVDGGFSRTYGSSGAAPFEMPREQTLSAIAADGDGPLVVPDVDRYPDREATAQVRALGGRFFGGAPLVGADGSRLGALTIIGHRPRRLYAPERERLAEHARFAMLLLAERLEAIESGAELADHRSTVFHAPAAIATVDRAGTIVAWNAAAERLYGWTLEEMAAGELLGTPPERRESVVAMLGRLFTTGESVVKQPTTGIDRAGRRLDLIYDGVPKRNAIGEIVGATFVVVDETAERRRTELERRRSSILELVAADAELGTIVAKLVSCVEYAVPGAHVAMLVRDGAGRCVPFTGDATDAFFTAQAAAHRAAPRPYPAALMRAGAFSLDELEPADGDAAMGAVVGALRERGYAAGWSAPIADSRGAFRGTLAVIHAPDRPLGDDEERAVAEAAALAAIALESDASRARLERLALHDPLTGLPNRTSLEQRLALVRQAAAERDGGFALAMLDLDRFKLVNDSLGHAVGDRLLVEVGNRIRAALRSTDFVARLAGDEFLVVIDDVPDRATATRVARKIVAALEPAFSPGGHELFVRASVGIAVYPDDATEPSELLRRVDRAMYAAKAGGCAFGFVDPGDDRASALAMETDLNRAVAAGEFELLYQPCVDVTNREVRCSEALLRWRHPRLGTLAPDRFIPIAEETGLIVPIGAWVLREACAFARRWRAAGGRGVVSVNVSARQFEDRNFVATVFAAVFESGIEPAQLWLEVTETLIMRSPETAAATLAELRRFGVRSVIDDFGTGYSSLAYLKRFPIDGLKIDRAFVKDLGAPGGVDDGDRAIVASIVALGRALGLAIVAEGAETGEQVAILRALGCDRIQGFFFARPMPEPAMSPWRPPAAPPAARPDSLTLVG